jgi:hypothetical protein
MQVKAFESTYHKLLSNACAAIDKLCWDALKVTVSWLRWAVCSYQPLVRLPQHVGVL